MRIAVAMSGGVDSSVAAALLAEQGHDIIGLSMQLYDQSGSGAEGPADAGRYGTLGPAEAGHHGTLGPADAGRYGTLGPADAGRYGTPGPADAGRYGGERAFGSCCTLDDLHDARRVAVRLGFPHYILNFERQFQETVIANFVGEYAGGRTPLPCAHCNSDLKFATLLERARGLGAGAVATGHYARVARDASGRWLLQRSTDTEKDQSYFLFSLTQEQLSSARFPVGSLTKAEVRAQARRLGLAVADKPDSQEICFVPDGDYASFVAREVPSVARAGAIVDESGRQIGSHGGVHRFTIGQRKGLGVSSPAPLYVLRIEPQEGRVTVGPRTALERTSLTATGVNWLAVDAPAAWLPVHAQIRHRHRPAPARVRATDTHGAELVFDEPQAAITPGQAVVFYDADVVVGGGWIA